jgi:hypothetical protein
MGSNQAKNDGFFRMIKIHSITSFRGEVKASVPPCKVLRHVNKPYEYERHAS